MTLAAISTFTTRNKDGYCYFKQETVAEKLGKSRQAISQHLNKLAELGYVEIIKQTYRGYKTNNAYRIRFEGDLKQDASSPCIDASSPCGMMQADVASKCSSINANKNKKKALTRDEFLREVSRGYEANAFQEFEHLSETEIRVCAEECLDFWEAKGEWPAGNPVPVIRYWIRGGIAKGKIRKPAKQTDRNGSAGEDFPNPMQAWQERLKPSFSDPVFRSWIRPLWHDGNGKLCAPTGFHAQYVQQNFWDDINRELKGVEIIHQPYHQPPTERIDHVQNA